MISKPIELIEEADLRQLIEGRIPESKQLEYKREMPDGSDAGKVKILKSVTAFANTQGGDLIYGMEAVKGVPTQLKPLTMPSKDEVLQRLVQLCADGVAPRLTGVRYHFVPLTEGGYVLVVRVDKSWNAPHRVTAGGHSQFYGRNAAGSYPLDVGELRQAFTLSGSIAERVRSFRADRLLMLGNGNAPVRLNSGALLVLHLVPLQSMTANTVIDFRSNSHSLMQVIPPGTQNWDQRQNLDGIVNWAIGLNGDAKSYALLFRTGAIEVVMVQRPWEGEKVIYSDSYEGILLDALKVYFVALSKFGVAPPAYAFISFLGVTGFRFDPGGRNSRDHRDHFSDRDALILPEVLIEDWSIDLSKIMRPAYDMIWNAFGFSHSLNFDQNDKWVGQRQ